MNSVPPSPRSARSASGIRPSSFRAPRGFTLLEILLAIAIIALIGTVLIGGGANLLAEKPATADEMFDKAVQEARKLALKSGKDVRLAFRREVDSRRFVLIDSAAPAVSRDGFAPPPDANAGVLAEYPVPNAGDLEVTFLSTQKGGNTILLGGVLVETTTVPYATFYTDGTCSPFRAQFMKNAAVHIISIDPWTCAPMLKPVDPNAP